MKVSGNNKADFVADAKKPRREHLFHRYQVTVCIFNRQTLFFRGLCSNLLGIVQEQATFIQGDLFAKRDLSANGNHIRFIIKRVTRVGTRVFNFFRHVLAFFCGLKIC